MRSALRLLALSATLASCAGPTPTTLAIECGDWRQADCGVAGRAATDAVRGQNGVPVRVEIGEGVYCPTPGLLFANTTCPAGGLPPFAGGEWIGHAQVTFDGSADRGYVNLARHVAGGALTGVLVAVATPSPPSSATGGKPPDRRAESCMIATNR